MLLGRQGLSQCHSNRLVDGRAPQSADHFGIRCLLNPAAVLLKSPYFHAQSNLISLFDGEDLCRELPPRRRDLGIIVSLQHEADQIAVRRNGHELRGHTVASERRRLGAGEEDPHGILRRGVPLLRLRDKSFGGLLGLRIRDPDRSSHGRRSTLDRLWLGVYWGLSQRQR
jgi:hypothetical protein